MSVDDPVYIPTLNRYEHFRNCVESLAWAGVKSANASFAPGKAV